MSLVEVIKIITERLISTKVAIATTLSSFSALLISATLLLGSSFSEMIILFGSINSPDDFIRFISALIELLSSEDYSQLSAATYALLIIFLFSYFSIVIDITSAIIKITNNSIQKSYLWMIRSNRRIILKNRKRRRREQKVRQVLNTLSDSEIAVLHQLVEEGSISTSYAQRDVNDAVENINSQYDFIYADFSEIHNRRRIYGLSQEHRVQVRRFIHGQSNSYIMDSISDLWVKLDELIMDDEMILNGGLFTASILLTIGFGVFSYQFIIGLFFVLALSPIIILFYVLYTLVLLALI